MNVNTLLEGSDPYKQFSAESAKLADKWSFGRCRPCKSDRKNKHGCSP